MAQFSLRSECFSRFGDVSLPAAVPVEAFSRRQAGVGRRRLRLLLLFRNGIHLRLLARPPPVSCRRPRPVSRLALSIGRTLATSARRSGSAPTDFLTPLQGAGLVWCFPVRWRRGAANLSELGKAGSGGLRRARHGQGRKRKAISIHPCSSFSYV